MQAAARSGSCPARRPARRQRCRVRYLPAPTAIPTPAQVEEDVVREARAITHTGEAAGTK